ncbi:protein SAWADEE HOMEODOMAIN HOMOLOG 1-like [Rhododendron vialii]|uniref:protein SAWADEE HOMEODOMAIN HOMOLOG 1-like n=1 Tax=Rhododendron vialii TaxID=182163 RepID=UPI00265E31B2|nr:protein SAWADEE HOMEODOMAIN HOMOLOG 1-like [Rhododendron vialii]
MESLKDDVTPSDPSVVVPEDPPLDFSIPINAPESHQKPKVESVPGLSDLVFEAKSSKDGAWYDVASFLNHRFLHTGELEVRVRFAEFRKEDDEWVNVERGVRERSIPLEPSECDRVNVGDLVLCFRETDEEAIYCDAHIVSIQRRLHDIRGCRCFFVVRYDDDEVEEKVQLTTLCSRPK